MRERSRASTSSSAGTCSSARTSAGRYRSEGTYYWLRDEGWGERQDGYDTIEWAAAAVVVDRQSRNAGSVVHVREPVPDDGDAGRPTWTAMFCAQFATNIYKDLYYAGGAIHMIMPTWLLTQK